jgi:hypothetical protein
MISARHRQGGERNGVRLSYVRGPAGVTLEFIQEPKA